MRKKITAMLSSVLVFSAYADFDAWKLRFAQELQTQGVSPTVAQQFMDTAIPYEKAIQHDNSQAEFKKFLWEYLQTAVSSKRVKNGQREFNANATLLNDIAMRTGVAPQILTAIWGMETSYGDYMGNVPLVSSLATLAYDSRRADFFHGELLAFLQLVDHGDIPSITVEGSWAGGMGMTQFIPSTYQHYAVDYNGDGYRNLWQKADALASTGAYLQAMGWEGGYTWGREVQLPVGFDYLIANDRQQKLSIAQWDTLGVTSADGQPLPQENIMARLFVPAGQFGPKFLLYKNFDVIKRYNNSDAYALAVSLLSDRIAGKSGLFAVWPTNAKKVRVNEVKIVQSALNAYGFDAGEVDGILGNGTRRALQAYQAANGMVADGFLTIDLYRRLVAGTE